MELRLVKVNKMKINGDAKRVKDLRILKFTNVVFVGILDIKSNKKAKKTKIDP